ncbi:DUF6314 family protein [Roseomonas elaeocarpi]|uniref:DUF6314 family protein n=1 Tax=Roseomonas elaeocarpi TaxID=907779 RepID=A0ABV6JVP4_9PROT
MAWTGDLHGDWLVRRRIVDHRARSHYVFEGQAHITPTQFRETGVMRANGSTMAATRSYQLLRRQAVLLVLHEDGTPFFSLDLDHGGAIQHRCGEDTYLGRFLRRDAGCWAESWRVQGPRKRYRSLTLYRRLLP